MVNYLDVLVAEEIYKERSREHNQYIYTPEVPSLGGTLSSAGRQFRKLLEWTANTIVAYQGQRAPVGRRLAAKRS